MTCADLKHTKIRHCVACGYVQKTKSVRFAVQYKVPSATLILIDFLPQTMFRTFVTISVLDLCLLVCLSVCLFVYMMYPCIFEPCERTTHSFDIRWFYAANTEHRVVLHLFQVVCSASSWARPQSSIRVISVSTSPPSCATLTTCLNWLPR